MSDSIYVAERVVRADVVSRIARLLVYPNIGQQLDQHLIWINREWGTSPGRRLIRIDSTEERNYAQRLIGGGRVTPFSQVPSAATVGELKGYNPSENLGFYFKLCQRTVELFILPMPYRKTNGHRYSVGCVGPQGQIQLLYEGSLSRTGLAWCNEQVMPDWLSAALEIIAAAP